jgi:hypothetical protein
MVISAVKTDLGNMCPSWKFQFSSEQLSNLVYGQVAEVLMKNPCYSAAVFRSLGAKKIPVEDL